MPRVVEAADVDSRSTECRGPRPDRRGRAGRAGPIRRPVAERGGTPLVERHRDTAHTPRAHIINQRTVEIFRHLGISDRFHAVATPQHLMASNLWITTLAGLEVARSETWGTSAERAADYRTASPEPMANCPQTVLEPMLLAAARDRGADIRFGWEFTGLAQDQDGRSEEHTSELQSRPHLVCRLLLEKKKN